MKMIEGTYRGGQIVPDTAVDWPDGERVVIARASDQIGLTEGVWPDDGSEDGRSELLRRVESFEALELTPAEQAEIAAALAESRRVSLEAVRQRMGLAP
jgi:hypothetical protein